MTERVFYTKEITEKSEDHLVPFHDYLRWFKKLPEVKDHQILLAGLFIADAILALKDPKLSRLAEARESENAEFEKYRKK